MSTPPTLGSGRSHLEAGDAEKGQVDSKGVGGEGRWGRGWGGVVSMQWWSEVVEVAEVLDSIKSPGFHQCEFTMCVNG